MIEAEEKECKDQKSREMKATDAQIAPMRRAVDEFEGGMGC